MKIYVSQIPPEGVCLSEDLSPEKLDLDTGMIKFRGPVRVKADIYKITNAVSCDLEIKVQMYCLCSRCIEEFELPLNKHLKLSYPVDRTVQAIDLDPDIRQEVILEYPLKPLCRQDCRGLCPKCGKNLNPGRCSCSN